MASEFAIRTEGLGKKYLIGHEVKQERYTALRDVISSQAQNLLKSVASLTSKSHGVAGNHVEEFWALRNVSFDIQKGEVVGFIGRNGAGKSTLLKVLSRITEPSEGRVEISGRISSLLEVGTGFHPELTGRENIFLNGAILGMTRSEVKRKFDEIVDFAGVERFLDTPVKRYSSGMYVRLAFSVAAHLEPEILIVDEVLAVGDAEFQKKCLGKMQQVSGAGRTVLFVSHNMATISTLCDRVILLNSGEIELDAPTDLALTQYTKATKTHAGRGLADRTDRRGSGSIRALDFEITDSEGNVVETLLSGRSYRFEVLLENTTDEPASSVDVAIIIRSETEVRFSILNTKYVNATTSIPAGKARALFKIDRFPFSAGNYRLSLRIFNGTEPTDIVSDAAILEVTGGDFYETGKTPPLDVQSVLLEFESSILPSLK